MKTLGIIPARYASTRFPGKPLAMLGDKPVIQWVYERSLSVLDRVCVATDDERIYDRVIGFKGLVYMTSPLHRSGTDRCSEALDLLGKDEKQHYDIVVNIQGDEPFIEPEQIIQLVNLFNDPGTQIGTLATLITDPGEISDPNKAKVVTDVNGFALMFSRSPLPFIRGLDAKDWMGKYPFLKHLGIYAFLPLVLREITGLPPSGLEMAESLEQLRWLQNGYRIRIGLTKGDNIGIDTPEDLEKARAML